MIEKHLKFLLFSLIFTKCFHIIKHLVNVLLYEKIYICGGNVHVLLYLPVWFDINDLVLYDIVV